MGSILLCGADKGQRFLYPTLPVLIHQPPFLANIAVAVDINIQAQEMERLRDELNAISQNPLASHSKRSKDTDRDFYMTADEAIKYGLADGVVEKFNCSICCSKNGEAISSRLACVSTYKDEPVAPPI